MIIMILYIEKLKLVELITTELTRHEQLMRFTLQNRTSVVYL